MDIRQLKYLSAVVNYRDYQLAARSFYLATGVVESDTSLENELGVALMEKVEENPAQQMPQLSWLPAALS